MLNQNTASVFLAKWFMERVRQLEKGEDGQVKANPSYKLAVIEDAYNVLGALDYSEVKEKLLTYDGEKSGAYNISSFLAQKVKNRRARDEHIKLGAFYMHPRLQETSKPPRVFIDYNTMEQAREEREPFYLEIVESFTTQDLLNYYYSKHYMDPAPGKGNHTQFENLLQVYSLDQALYLIDASAMSMHDDEYSRWARRPAFLTEFLQEAEELMNYRMNKLKEGGLTHIVPRQEYFE